LRERARVHRHRAPIEAAMAALVIVFLATARG
jgi:hypothetical protein